MNMKTNLMNALGLFLMYALSCMGAVPRIAIIGGGIGGASTAYWLRELFEESEIVVDLYECNEIGGRIASVEFRGRQYETGGSILHPSNRYMKQFMKISGLEERDPNPSFFGIFNGREYPFKESYYDFVTTFRLLWRYGNDVFNLKNLINFTLDKFVRIYEVQKSRYAFTTVENLLAAMSSEFRNMTQLSIEGYLESKHFGDKLISELAEAVMNVNYGQTTSNLHAFVGSVSLAGAMPGLFSVKGGNKLVPAHIIRLSLANVINSTVQEVHLNEDESLTVVSMDSSKKIQKRYYDIAVLAVPLVDGVSNVLFKGFPNKFSYERKYHRIYTTLVQGKINLHNLDLTNADIIQEILVNNKKLFFNSLSRLYPVDYEEGESTPEVFKVFSEKPLSSSELDWLFQEREGEEKVVDWWAYPNYSPIEKTDPFVLHRKLFWTSPIETAASAMEMSAISGYNAALLTFHTWRNTTNKIDFVGTISHRDEL